LHDKQVLVVFWVELDPIQSLENALLVISCTEGKEFAIIIGMAILWINVESKKTKVIRLILDFMTGLSWLIHFA